MTHALLHAAHNWIWVFAPVADRPRQQRQFFWVSFIIGFLLICQLVLGALT